MELYFITGNKNKFEEVKAIFPEIKQFEFDLVEIQNIDPMKVIQEKVTEARKFTDKDFLVEDISLAIEGMNGMPGSLIKWFLTSIGTEGIFALSGVFGDKAKVTASLGLSTKKGIKIFQSEVSGKIVSPRGKGWGFDPIFMPDRQTQTYAEMEFEEKNKISHRKLVWEKLKSYLKK